MQPWVLQAARAGLLSAATAVLAAQPDSHQVGRQVVAREAQPEWYWAERAASPEVLRAALLERAARVETQRAARVETQRAARAAAHREAQAETHREAQAETQQVGLAETHRAAQAGLAAPSPPFAGTRAALTGPVA